MELNENLDVPVMMHAAALPWAGSPAAGVERRMLFRIGGERARATSIVRYAPGSAFASHHHGGGEELLVLDGVFQDERGDYPAGTYVRNPPGSAHAPASIDGALIFVRLWQFAAHDTARVVVRPGDGHPVPPRPGVDWARALFTREGEQVRLERWQPMAPVTLDNACGLELLVVKGEVTVGADILAPHDWLRLPPGHAVVASAGANGATVWVRLGALLLADVCGGIEGPACLPA